MKSHNKIAWKLQVMKTFWKLDYAFWYVLYLIPDPHVIMSWASGYPHKLEKMDEQPKACMCDENLTKNWKMNMTSYDMIFILDHEEKVSFNSEMYFMTFGWK
jgi:hypothetical protein